MATKRGPSSSRADCAGTPLAQDGFDSDNGAAVTTFSGTLPDVASWILMIGGFGSTGTMMRCRLSAI